MRLSHFISILIWTLLPSWATSFNSEKGLQPTTSEEPTVCSIFLSLFVKRQWIPQPLPLEENIQVSPAHKPQVFLHVLGDDLGAQKFSQVLLTWGKTTSPSVSKNPLVSGRPVIKYSPFMAVIVNSSSQCSWLVYMRQVTSRAWVKILHTHTPPAKTHTNI